MLGSFLRVCRMQMVKIPSWDERMNKLSCALCVTTSALVLGMEAIVSGISSKTACEPHKVVMEAGPLA